MSKPLGTMGARTVRSSGSSARFIASLLVGLLILNTVEAQIMSMVNLPYYVYVYNLNTGNVFRTFPTYTTNSYPAKIYGEFIIFPYSSKYIAWGNWMTGGWLSYDSTGNSGVITALEKLNGDRIASGADDSLIRVFSTSSYYSLSIRNLTGHTGQVNDLKLLTSGSSMLASASNDYTVRIWDYENASLLFNLTGHSGYVTVLECLSNQLLASGGSDAYIIIWNYVQGALVRTMTGSGSTIRSLRMYDSDTLYSGSLDGYARKWNVSSGQQVNYVYFGSAPQAIDLPGDDTLRIVLSNNYVYTCPLALNTYNAYLSVTSGTVYGGGAATLFSKHYRIIFGTVYNYIRLYSPLSMSLITTLAPHSTAYSYYAKCMVRINRNVFATSSTSYEILIWHWNMQTNAITVLRRIYNGDSSNALELLSDGVSLASTATYTLNVWNTITGQKSLSYYTGYYIYDLKQLPNGNLILACSDGYARVINPFSGSWVITYYYAPAQYYYSPSNSYYSVSSDVFSVAVLPNGYFITSSPSGIRMWNPDTGSLIYNWYIYFVTGYYSPYNYRVKYLGFINGYYMVGFASYQYMLFFYVYSSFTAMSYLGGVNLPLSGYVYNFHRVDKQVMVTGDSGYIYLINPTTVTLINTVVDSTGTMMFSGTAVDTSAPILRAAYGDTNGTMQIWDMTNKTVISELTNVHSSINHITFISYNRMITAGDSVLKLWDSENGFVLQTMTGHSNNVTCLEQVSNTYIASGSVDSTVKIWNYFMATLYTTLSGHSGQINALKLLNNGNLASASSDQTIKIWNWATGSLVYTLTNHTNKVNALENVMNGSLASGSTDMSILIWNPDTGSLLTSLLGHTDAVLCLKYLSSYGYLASGSADTTIRIWDVTYGSLVRILTGHTTSVRSLDVYPDSSLISSSLNNSVLVWNVVNGSQVDKFTNVSSSVNFVRVFHYPRHLPYITNRCSDYKNPVIMYLQNSFNLSSTLNGLTTGANSLAYDWQIYKLDSNFSSLGSVMNQISYTNSSDISFLFTLLTLDLFTVFRVVLTVNMTTYDPVTVQTSQIDSYFKVMPRGVAVQTLSNSSTSTNASIARYSSFAIAPSNFSYDLDAKLPTANLSFMFYCLQVNKTLGYLYYLNQSLSQNITDLKTARDLNYTQPNSCFKSTDGYYFDSTNNTLFINPNSLIYDTSYNNMFIVNTTIYNLLTNYQIVTVNIDPSVNQIPTGSLSCVDSSLCTNTSGNYSLIRPTNDIVINATCSYGCSYVDSVTYSFSVYKYNSSSWVLITGTMNDTALINSSNSSNQLTLNRQLFQSGLAMWRVDLVTTTTSYGVKTVSNVTTSMILILSEMPVYNSVCSLTNNTVSSLKTNYSASCQFTQTSTTSNLSITARRGDMLTLSGVLFTPSIYYSSVSYAYQVSLYNTSSVPGLDTSTAVNNSNFTSNVLYLSNFTYGWYKIAVQANTVIMNSYIQLNQSYMSYIDLNVIPSGINVSALSGFAQQAKVARYNNFTLTPTVYSLDYDNYINVSAISYLFYCQQVLNSTSTLINQTNLVDLYTAKLPNVTLSTVNNSCFNTTDAFHFDSTGNMLFVDPGYLAYTSGYTNQFLIVTINYGVTSFQKVTISIDNTNNQIPLGGLNFDNDSVSVSVATDSYSISPYNSITLNASCTYGCVYVDSTSFKFEVRVYNNSNWTLIDSNSSISAYFNVTSNQVMLAKEMFQLGSVAWKVNLITTTVSYGVSTVSNVTKYVQLVLSSLPVYNSACNYSSTQVTALSTKYSMTCYYLLNESPRNHTITLRRGDELNMTQILFTPQINYQSLSTYFEMSTVSLSNVPLIQVANTVNITTQNKSLKFDNNPYGLYYVALTPLMNITTPVSYLYQSIPPTQVYVQVIPSGINISALANFSQSATVPRYQNYTVNPPAYSIDLDSYINVSSIVYVFYCQQVSNSSGLTFYLNSSNNTDLLTAKTNQTLASSCFNSIDGYSFDSTGNTLYVDRNGLKFTSGYNNQFIVTTTNAGVFNYQMFNLNINIYDNEMPVSLLSIQSPTTPTDLGNSSYLIDFDDNLILNASCTFGCSYVDNVNYKFTVYQYNNSNWTQITASSSEYSFINITDNKIELNKNLFLTGLISWKVEVLITTTSYGVATVANKTSTMTFRLNELPPYNSNCSAHSTVQTSIRSDYSIACSYVQKSNDSELSLTLRRGDFLNISSLVFVPSLNYVALNLTYTVHQTEWNHEVPVVSQSDINFTYTSNTSLGLGSFNYGQYKISSLPLIAMNSPVALLQQNLSTISINLLVIPSGINISSLANFSTKDSVSRYMPYTINPASSSLDLDNFINISAINFTFYCKQISNSSGFVYFLNGSNSTDLLTAKTNAFNMSSVNTSCFASTDGYSFDSTGNVIYIEKNALRFTSGYNNQFIVTTTNAGVYNYQMFNLNINIYDNEMPVSMLSIENPLAPTDLGNSSYLIDFDDNLILNASCTFGCSYVDNVSYKFTVYQYNNSNWTQITASSTEYGFINITDNKIELDKNLFLTGLISWKVEVLITTTSYGVATVANKTSTMTFRLNELPPYNSNCSAHSTVQTSIRSDYSIACSYVQKSNESELSLTLRRGDFLNISSLVFVPSLNYVALNLTYTVHQTEWNHEVPVVSQSDINFTYTSNTSLGLGSFNYGQYKISSLPLIAMNSPVALLQQNLSTISINLLVIPSGINISSLANFSTKDSVSRYMPYTINPASSSLDLDNFINISAINFTFYCKQISNSSGFVYFLNGSNSTDLLTAKTNAFNMSSVNTSCFASTDGYSFDTTGNVLSIDRNALKFTSGYNNQFIVTTTNGGVYNYQMFDLNINIYDNEIPVGVLDCNDQSLCQPSVIANNSFIIPNSHDLTLNASCSFGCSFVDSVVFSFQVYEYIGTSWVSLSSNSSYFNIQPNNITLKSTLFKTGPVLWKVDIVTTTTSYGVKTTSNSSFMYGLNMLSYNGSCNSSSLASSIQVGCTYWPDSIGNVTYSTVTALKTNKLNFTGSKFSPSLSLSGMSYSFELYQYSDWTGSTDNWTRIDTSALTTDNQVFDLLSLDYGWYRFFVYASVNVSNLITEFSWPVSSFINIHLIATGVNISALPQFNQQVYIPRYESFNMTPVNTYTYDIDGIITDVSTMKFLFYCKLVSKSGGFSNYLLNDTSLVDLKTAKENNVDLSKVSGSCFSSTDDYYFDTTGNTFYMNPDAVKHYSSFNNEFVIKTVNFGITSYQMINIAINTSLILQPLITITCHTPIFCKPTDAGILKIADSNNLQFDSICPQGCQYVDSVNYTYSFYQYNATLSQWVLVDSSNSLSKYIYGSKTDTLTLLYNIFQSGLTNWRVNLTATAYSYGASSTSPMVWQDLGLNQLPYQGTCWISPLAGFALKTYFNIQCSNWADFDGQISRYEYFATYDGNTNDYGLSFDYVGNVNIQFPAGPSSQDFMLTVYVCVFDDLNGPSKFVLPTKIQVKIDAGLVTNMLGDVISGSGSSGALSKINANDPVGSSNFITSFASTINVLAATSPSSGDLVVSAKTSLMGTMSKMSVPDLSTAKVVATSVATLTSNVSTIDKDTASLAMTKSLEYANVMINSIDMFGFDFLMQAGNQIVGAMGNSMLGLNHQITKTESTSISSADQSSMSAALSQSKQILDTMSHAVNVYLFNGQSSSITTDSINVTNSKSYLSDMNTNVDIGSKGQFKTPDVCSMLKDQLGSSNCEKTFIVQQAYSLANPITGTNGQSSSVSINGSSTVSLAFYGPDSNEIKITNSEIDIWIERTANATFPDWTVYNMSMNHSSAAPNNQTNGTNQLHQIGFNLKDANLGVNFQLKPEDESIGYLVCIKYGSFPYINEFSFMHYDNFKVYCPSDLTTQGNGTYYLYFLTLNSSQTGLVGFGIRELSESENLEYCANSTNNAQNLTLPPVFPMYDANSTLELDNSTMSNITIIGDFNQTNSTSNETTSGPLEFNFYYRLFTSGCFYFDKTSVTWKSDGVVVQPDTNSTHVHCISSHLTEFAGGGVNSASPVLPNSASAAGLPPSIDFNNAFANASFTQNLTIYLTIIITTSLYIILMIWCIWMDKRDEYKRRIYLLEDNESEDLYFYEMIVFSGNRRDAGTKSRVSFTLSGSLDDTVNRKLIPRRDKNKILERGSINTFVFSTPKSLGSLNYIRIWHDNSGKGRHASWYLKFIIMHDLQTRDQFFFICENWLALDHGDGMIDRMLPVTGDKQKTDVKFLIEKQTKEKMSDSHLWFSVVARPPLSTFTRADRVTCCFVLMYISMLMNILYYGQDNSSSGSALQLGPMMISQSQILVGVVVTLISLPPSLLLIQIFRRSRRRKTRGYQLKSTMKSSNEKAHDDPNSKILKKKKKQFQLPWWFKIIAYVMAFCYFVICAFFVLLKAFTLGNEQCSKWLTSFLTSIFTDCFLTSPLQIVIVSTILVCIFRKKNSDDLEYEYDHDDQGRALNILDDPTEIDESKQMERNYALHFLADRSKLTDVQASQIKKRRLQENKYKANLRELFIYALFVWIILLIAFTKVDKNSYQYQVSLQNMLHLNDFKLDSYSSIKNTNQIWSWMKETFMPSMLFRNWYNNNTVSFSNYSTDASSFIVGQVLIRQLRVKIDSCHNTVSTISVKNCYLDYNVFNQDDDDYGLSWGSYNSSYTATSSEKDVYQAFQYKDGASMDTQAYVGEYATYLPGGYVYVINGNDNHSQVIQELESLQSMNWLNQQSRALFIQFSLYNPNVNLFAYGTILFEILPTGSILHMFQIIPFSLYSPPGFATLITAGQIIYMAIMVFFMARLIRALVKKGWRVCVKEFWFYVDWILIIFSWVTFSMFIYRLYALYDFSNKLKGKSSGKFINMQSLCYWDGLYVIMIATCTFLSIIKTLKLLRFSSNLNFIIRTMAASVAEIGSFCVILLITWIAYVNLTYLYFNEHSQQFRSFLSSLETCGQMILGKYDASTFTVSQLYMAPLILVSYTVVIIFIMLQIFVTVLSDTFSRIRKEFQESRTEQDITMGRYLKDKVKTFAKDRVANFRRKPKKMKTLAEPSEYKSSIELLEIRSAELIDRIKSETSRKRKYRVTDQEKI